MGNFLVVSEVKIFHSLPINDMVPRGSDNIYVRGGDSVQPAVQVQVLIQVADLDLDLDLPSAFVE